MAEEQNTDRWGEIRGIHREYANFYRMLRGGVIIGLFVVIGWSVFQENGEPRAFGMNLWTEIAGIAVTVLIIDLLNERRAERRFKQGLLEAVTSPSACYAVHAAHLLVRRGWHRGENSFLKGINLSGANLEGAFLPNANLQGAKLDHTNLAGAFLEDADFRHVNIEDANFRGAQLNRARFSDVNTADFRDAEMHFVKFESKSVILYCNFENVTLSGVTISRTHWKLCNLRNADLAEADFSDAILDDIDFQNADMSWIILKKARLYGSNLQGVNLEEAEFDAETILPDGTHWTRETDMSRFTDAAHPNFWRDNRKLSPTHLKNECYIFWPPYLGRFRRDFK
jgi:uncharacterized protein YjbI with pentapeptide repeats